MSRAVLAVLSVVVFLLAGAGAYVGARSYRLVQTTQRCDVFQCIPRLKPDAVTAALRKQGHTCEQEDSNRINCSLSIGTVHFVTTLGVADNGIFEIRSSVVRTGGDPLPKAGLAYLGWFATLPYRDDSVTSAEIQKWLAQSLQAKKDTKATIGDYEYVLTNPEPVRTELQIEGKS